MSIRKSKKIIALVALIASLLFSFFKDFWERPEAVYERPVTKDLIVKVLDIGQGDAILLLAGEDTVLVDSGDVGTRSRLVKLLHQEGVKKIDLLVATHPHNDHIGGMQAVLDNFKVEKILDSGQVHTTKTFRDYLQLADRKKIAFEQAKRGAVYSFDNDVTLKVLWPDGKFLQDTSGDLNNNSIVLLAQKGAFRMLLTGDVQDDAENILRKEAVQASVLKAPHHGSNTSSTNAFLRSVGAKEAIISCGKDNDYGFPHDKVLNRYKSNGMSVYVTSEAGTVTVTTDGKSYHIEKER